MKNSSTIALALVLGGLASSNLDAQNSFKAGDIYLSTPVHFGISSDDGAILRIDPVAGTTSLFLAMPGSPNGQDGMAYDPYRDRLVVRGGFAFGDPVENFLVDADGNRTSLGYASVGGPVLGGFAPSNIGNIYFRGYFSSSEIHYYDSNDVEQTLMDSTGLVPWNVPGFAGVINHMLHHPETNSLLIAYVPNPSSVCSGGNPQAVPIRRVDLSPDGSRVVNVECIEFDLDPGTFSGVPVGLSPGPGDDVILTIDNNNTKTLPRMVRIDPAALTATPYAYNSNLSNPATNAGCYSHALGQAVILDTGQDVLRAFSAGSVSAGAIIATGVSPDNSSGEVATLCEIGQSGNQAMTASSATISLANGGSQNWSMDFGPEHAGEVYLVLGSSTGWNPGQDIGAVHLPLITDAYSYIVVNRAGSQFFPMSLGVLDGLGRASSAIVLGPGMDPGLAGVTLYHATACFGPMPLLVACTNAVAVTLE